MTFTFFKVLDHSQVMFGFTLLNTVFIQLKLILNVKKMILSDLEEVMLAILKLLPYIFGEFMYSFLKVVQKKS